MNVISLPARYGSAFRPACFALSGTAAPDGVEIEIRTPGVAEPLGVKRLYAATPEEPFTAAVNVAPYARLLLSPEPMCGSEAGIYLAPGRSAACYVSAPGGSSQAVMLCAGTEVAPLNTLLSAAPRTVKIAPGERDEMAIVSDDWVVPTVSFRRGRTVYTDSPMGQRNAAGMLCAVIDPDAVGRAYARKTGAPASEMTEFTVRLVLEQPEAQGRVVERHYMVERGAISSAAGSDAAGNATTEGQRLAWVNRFGAVDYHTFPTVDELRARGESTRIETPAGRRTVATAAAKSVTLLSDPCDGPTAEWLSEIFSSPSVWAVDGAVFEAVEVEAGEVVVSPGRPSVVSVTVRPAVPNVSRKL